MMNLDEALATGPEGERGSADTDRPISKRLTFLLHRLVAVLMDGSSAEFRDYGLSIPAARAMVVLLDHGGAMTVRTLADTTQLDLSTTSHILRRLEHAGYLERQRQQDDNRVVIARLSTTGTDIAQKCREASLRHEAVLIRGMAPEEVAVLKALLAQAYDNARDGFSV